MLSRLFNRNKKKATTPIKKKPAQPAAPRASAPKAKKSGAQKILTAEGWRRLMMHKYSKGPSR